VDGIRADRSIRGRLDRPSMEIVLRDYPSVIIGLISGLCSISYAAASGPNGARSIHVTLPAYRSRFILHEEDFAICRKIAILFSQNKSGPGPISAFSSEPIQDLKSRIAAYLKVEFEGRP
jgi:hypothetical protein